MDDSLCDSGNRGPSSFSQVAEVFLADPGLPFVRLLSAERIERVFRKHGNLFGMRTVYSTAIMVWSFLGQVLRDGKEAGCQAAVARIIVHQQSRGEAVPTSDTGDYCRARAKLSEHALHDLTVEIAEGVEEQAPQEWLWKERHTKLVDGFTFTMPDTAENQAAYLALPDELPLRELCYTITKPGARTFKLTIVTTLIDEKAYTKAEIAELYGFRWNAELYQPECTSSAGLYQLAA